VIRILESKNVGRLLSRKAARFEAAEAVVRPILDAVRKRGDRALLEYARKFDGLDRRSVRVPEAELAQIFDPFYRLDTSRNSATGGVGLGLAIVKTCVESCQGAVSCFNRKPSGLEVSLRLSAG